MIDYVDLCKKYYAASRIPTNLTEDGQEVYSTIGTLLQLSSSKHYPSLSELFNPSILHYSPEILYGCIHIKDSKSAIILGPVFESPVTEALITTYMREAAIPLSFREQTAEFLYSIPTISSLQLARHLSFLHSVLNHKDVAINDILWVNQESAQEREALNVKHFIEHQESNALNSSHYLELGLYEWVRTGKPEQLIQYLKATPLNLSEKNYARSPLRQAKNIFINIATNAGMLGAIPGGVSVEKTYHLMDIYIQECEQLQTVEDIAALQYQMLIDFCQKVSETKIPDGISSDVYVCMNYIRSHTNEAIRVENVAEQIGKSVSYVTKKFKENLGINPGAYINRCKLEESKSLLTYTNKSLAEISNYLCYSSQAHFQTAFRKKYNITPLQYRQKTQKLNR